jgi:hypothetical protein
MAQTKKSKSKKFDFDNDPSYQKLLADITKIIKEAEDNGLDLRKRPHCLGCRHCGAYEYGETQTQDERTVRVYDKNNQLTDRTPFLIIDRKETSYRREKIHYYKTRYTFICSACGSHQEQIAREQFDDY